MSSIIKIKKYILFLDNIKKYLQFSNYYLYRLLKR